MSRKLNDLSIGADIFPGVLIVFVLWTAATVGIAAYVTGGDTTLEELVKSGLTWSVFTAAIIAIGAVFIFRVREEVGFTPMAADAGWILPFIAAVFVALLLLRGLTQQAFPVSQIVWICANALLVGISEELMFRGLLFSGLYKRYSYWAAIIGVSILFGLVHVLNGFITGDFQSGIFQSILATFSGLLFMAVRIGMGSIVPAILLHWLWDFGLFINPVSSWPDSESMTGLDTAVSLVAVTGPVVFGILGTIALFRLRKRLSPQ
ncbi:MAG: CPBP family intramembrane metalloprotease [marine bacterium B5-7]|nr:MAG: CPBP family intramembrane metalloprotease [marine bacterium B5-7]